MATAARDRLEGRGSVRTIWQIAAGSVGGPVADTFLRHGVALVGAGAAYADLDAAAVRRFVEEVALGDAILLRSDGGELLAVGVVASDYEWLPQFDDVAGRLLPHARRVRWQPLPEPYRFPEAALGRRRFSGVGNADVARYVEQFLASPPVSWQAAQLPALPIEEPALEDVPPKVADLAALAGDMVPLYADRARFPEAPAESETVAHFVIPLLIALGWRTDLVAVEWHDIDVALFRSGPRVAGSCELVIEAKRFGAEVERALGQAKGYLDALGGARDVVVTDGIRYRAYSAARGHTPVAYANLMRLRRSAAELLAFLRPRD